MKKYGRIVRKSYFPNLFFKQDFKLAGKKLSHIFRRIRFNFHNTLFLKIFPLNSPGEKKSKCLIPSSTIKFDYLKSHIVIYKKQLSLNSKFEGHELQNLTLQLVSPGLPSRSSTFLELITPEFIDLNYLPVNFAFPNPKFSKVKSFGNKSRILDSVVLNETQILWNRASLFLKGNSLFFVLSRINAFNQKFYQKPRLAADSPAYLPIPILAANGLPRRINSKALRKIKEFKLSGQDISLREDIPALRFRLGIKRLRPSDYLLGLLNRPFNPKHLKQKLWAQKVKIENSQAMRQSVSGEAKKIIWEKHDLIERSEEEDVIEIEEKQEHRKLIGSMSRELVTVDGKQKYGSQIRTNNPYVSFLLDLITNSQTLPGSRMIQNMNFRPSIQFLIKNFQEKIASFLYLEFSSSPISSGMSLNAMNEQNTGLPFYEKERKQLPSTGKKFSTKNAIAGIKIPEKLSKNLFLRQSEFLKEDKLGFPGLSIRSTFKLITIIENPLLIGKSGILSFGAVSSLSARILRDHKNKRYKGYNRSEGSFLEHFTMFLQQYTAIINEIRAGSYEKIRLPSIEKQIRNQQSVQKLSSSLNSESKSSEYNLVRVYNWLTALTHTVAVVSQLNRQEIDKAESAFFTPDSHAAIRPASRAPNCAKIYTFSDVFKHLEVPNPTIEVARTTDYLTADYRVSDPHAADHYRVHNQKVGSKREPNREKQYSVKVNELQNALNQQILLKSLEVITFRLKRTEALLRSHKMNVFRRARYVADSPAYPPIPASVASDHFRKIQSEISRKIEKLKLSDHGFLCHVDVPEKGFSPGTKDFIAADKLLEPLIMPHSPEKLKRKLQVRRTTVESSQLMKYLVSKPSKLVIWEKQNLIERRGKQDFRELNLIECRKKQDIRELINSRSWSLVIENCKQRVDSKIRIKKANLPILLDPINNSQTLPDSSGIKNKSLSSSAHFLIQSFPEENLSCSREYSSGSGSSRTGRSITNEQKKGFLFFKRRNRQSLSPSGIFSAKKAIAGKKTSGKSGKNLLFLQNSFPLGDMPNIPGLSLRSTSKLVTLIERFLLISKSGILSLGVINHESARVSWDHKSKSSMGYKSSERVFLEFFTSNFRKYTKTIADVRDGIFEEIIDLSVENKKKNLQYVLKLNFFHDLESKISESTITRVFNCLKTFVQGIAAGFQQSRRNFQTGRFMITPNSSSAFQPNRQETEKQENLFFTSGFHTETKPASCIIPISNSLEVLLAGNKLTHTGVTNTIDSLANTVQEKKYISLSARLQKTFKLPEILMLSSVATVEGENPAYPQKKPMLREFYNIVTYRSTKATYRFTKATYKSTQPVVEILFFTTARIFNNQLTSKSNFLQDYTHNYSTVLETGIKDIYSYLQQSFQALNYAGTHIVSEIYRHLAGRKPTNKVILSADYLKEDYQLSFHHATEHYTADGQKMENKREQNRGKQRSIHRNKRQNKFTGPLFLKYLNTIAYRFEKLEKFPYSSTLNLLFNDNVISISGLKEVYSGPQQTSPLQITSAYTGIHPVTLSLNYLTNRTQIYHAFWESAYERAYPFKYSTTRTRDLKSGTISHMAISNYARGKTLHYSKTLNNDHLEKRNGLAKGNDLEEITDLEKILGLTLSNLLLSLSRKRAFSVLSKKDVLKFSLFNASVPLLSGTGGTASRKKNASLFSLLRYASLTISKNPVFARESEASLNSKTGSSSTESLGYKTASFSNHIGEQKLKEQNFPQWKKVMMNFSQRGGKIEYRKAENFLQRGSLNHQRRENVIQQVNKKMNTSAVFRMNQRISSEFVLSARPDFELETKWKKVSSAMPVLEKKSEDRKDISKRLLFKFRIFHCSDKNPKPHMNPKSKINTYFAFSMRRSTGKTPEFTAFGPSGKTRSELMHAWESEKKTRREDLVYGTSQTLIEEVKRIEKIVFETKEAVADHLESHLPQVAGKVEQVLDIEQMSDEIMRMINYKLEIEAERRGIF